MEVDRKAGENDTEVDEATPRLVNMRKALEESSSGGM